MLTLAVVLIRRYYLRRAYSNRHGHFSINLEDASSIQQQLQQQQELQQQQQKDVGNSGRSEDSLSPSSLSGNSDTLTTSSLVTTSSTSTMTTLTLRENSPNVVNNKIVQPNAGGVIINSDSNTNSHDSDNNAQIHHFEHQHDLSLISEDEKEKSVGDDEYDISPDALFILEMNIEYRSLGKLLYIIPIYQVTVYLTGFIVLLLVSNTGGTVETIIKTNKVNTFWWSFFNTISAFNNVGITLLNDNMIQLNRSSFVLFVISILIVMGNTLFPVILRFIIFILRKISKDPDPYEHLLNNPRSVSLMAILEANEKAFAGMSSGDTFVNYLFHSISTRTGGFNSIDISLLSNSVLLLFIGLMFVSSYPFVISLKGSAVNGKYAAEEKTREVMKDLLIRDIFILYICILLIGIFEETRLDIPDNSFTVFHVMFEVVSAFGTVGLTMGNPKIQSSFSTLLGVTSKLIIIIVMLLGKHRSLPDSVDNAVAIQDKDILSKFLRRKYRQYKY
ncbi:transmembrane protein [Heterostelium album PN500]|uniref:Transmembrane protein n=1 Tax=Heterostelium pallidum (strain ATCC 26659 / Pp 5 / PN500) TaxID=670386 RepID=D3BGN2_HETP5|nr:transmembrane protein [Heterostelium album PN500]EFA79266.1 transmembrane protein [Heterostelium album PN500]|eukprot:XP_020431387.1 transmembrane protein [Heterostelium album PN500]